MHELDLSVRGNFTSVAKPRGIPNAWVDLNWFLNYPLAKHQANMKFFLWRYFFTIENTQITSNRDLKEQAFSFFFSVSRRIKLSFKNHPIFPTSPVFFPSFFFWNGKPSSLFQRNIKIVLFISVEKKRMVHHCTDNSTVNIFRLFSIPNQMKKLASFIAWILVTLSIPFFVYIYKKADIIFMQLCLALKIFAFLFHCISLALPLSVLFDLYL